MSYITDADKCPNCGAVKVFSALVCPVCGKSYSASDNDWSAMIWNDGEVYLSKTYSIRIVNRVGGGDSFSGGLIYGLRKGLPMQEALEFATAASCLKHTIEMDFNLVSVQEVEALKEGNGSGRVQR